MRIKLVLLLFLFPLLIAAQTFKVQGTVVSETDGSPLPGVTVNVVGTTNSTITDIDGHYSINPTCSWFLSAL